MPQGLRVRLALLGLPAQPDRLVQPEAADMKKMAKPFGGKETKKEESAEMRKMKKPMPKKK